MYNLSDFALAELTATCDALGYNAEGKYYLDKHAIGKIVFTDQ